MSNLLVIDFDFFFPEPDPATDAMGLYDWGRRESVLAIEVLWQSRAAAFLRRDMELPGLTGEQHGFWNRFNFTPDARLFAAESNACAANTALTNLFGYPDNGVAPDEVWLYDAHHDAGYRPDIDIHALLDKGMYSCEDWMFLWHALGSKLNVRYPSWKDYAFDVEPDPIIPVDRQFDATDNGPDVEFDAVFLCRSGAWVPSWLDGEFFQFLADAPFSSYIDLFEDTYPLKPRPLDMDAVRWEADEMRKILERHQAALGVK